MTRDARPGARLRAGFRTLRVLWHLPSFVRLYWRLYRDPRVPLAAKAGLTAAVVYLVSPIDLIPDYWLPIIGFADDAAVLWFATRWFIAACPTEVVTEHVRRIDEERRFTRRR
ncbi:MAG: DUF1232 domain-containing protein [Deltaproteobacteria bacterium]|nr:DUF1232 domain-containing protein [Deltaproteobacteria bacterium]